MALSLHNRAKAVDVVATSTTTPLAKMVGDASTRPLLATPVRSTTVVDGEHHQQSAELLCSRLNGHDGYCANYDRKRQKHEWVKS